MTDVRRIRRRQFFAGNVIYGKRLFSAARSEFTGREVHDTPYLIALVTN